MDQSTPSSSPTLAQEASIPLTSLARGQRGRISADQLMGEDSATLRAMGLRPDASVQMCRLGEPCIISLSESCGGGCRIGLAKDIASRVMVTPDSQR